MVENGRSEGDVGRSRGDGAAVPEIRLVKEVVDQILVMLARMLVMATEVGSGGRRGWSSAGAAVMRLRGRVVSVPAPSWPIWIGSGGEEGWSSVDSGSSESSWLCCHLGHFLTTGSFKNHDGGSGGNVSVRQCKMRLCCCCCCPLLADRNWQWGRRGRSLSGEAAMRPHG